MIVTGLDLSLTGTGAARVDTQRGEIVDWKLFTSAAPKPVQSPVARKRKLVQLLWDRALRLNRLQRAIVHFAQLSDLVVIEAPAYSRVGGHQHDRSGLFYMVAGEVLATISPIAEVAPTSLKLYATGDGSADKAGMLAAMRTAHPELASTNDNIIDAGWLAVMGARAIGEPIDTTASWKTRAVSSTLWPTLKRESA